MEPRELCSMAIIGRDALVLARHLAEMTWAAGMTTILERRFPALWDETFSVAQLDFSEQPSAYPVRPLDMLVCLSHPVAAMALCTVDQTTTLVYDPDTCEALASDFPISYPVPVRRLAHECGAGARLAAVAFGALAGLLCGPGFPARLLLQALPSGDDPAQALYSQLIGLRYVELNLTKCDPWHWAVPEYTGPHERPCNLSAALPLRDPSITHKSPVTL